MADTEALLARKKLSAVLRRRPIIELYETAEDLAKVRPYHDLGRREGFRLNEISGVEASRMEPAISSDFEVAVVKNDWGFVVDSRRFVVELHRAFRARGGIVAREEAVGFKHSGASAAAVMTRSGNEFAADQVVIAAGAHSRLLARRLGASLQLEGVAGYQVQLQAPSIEIEHGVVFPKGGIGITPYESGLAVSGGAEFARGDVNPSWSRAERMLENARRVLPDLNSANVTHRIGVRPMTPDTRPIIGRLPQAPNVVLATGHGQLGVTLAATTARSVAAIVARKPCGTDLSAFRPNRFQV